MYSLQQMKQEIAGLLLGGPARLLALNTCKEVHSPKAETEADLSEKANCLICFYPHVHADGDALGSCVALALVCEKLGYQVKILGSEAPQEALVEVLGEKLTQYYVYGEQELALWGGKQDFALRLDNSQGSRLAERLPFYLDMQRKKLSLTLDHHLAEQGEEGVEEKKELFLYRDTKAAATCEMVCELIQEMEQQSGLKLFDFDVARALMLGLITDTGRFTYSNVGEKTFQAAAHLMKYGVVLNELVYPLYDEMRVAQMRLKGRVFRETNFTHQGRMVTALVDSVAYASESASSGDMEGLSAELRNVRGVDMAIFLRTFSNGELKASVRSSERLSAHRLVSVYGGGGHAKAAGFSFSLEALVERFVTAEDLEKYSTEPLLFMEKARHDQSEIYKKVILPKLCKALEQSVKDLIEESESHG